jgi:hypothetical protein
MGYNAAPPLITRTLHSSAAVIYPEIPCWFV